MVEGARSKFSLESIKLEDLADVRVVALEASTAFLVEEPLTDVANENSCTLTYFEVGPHTMRLGLVNAIVMQYLSEPFFNELRTQQQLGYVVSSRESATRNVLGNRFLIQSPKHACEYLVHKINDFLVEVHAKLQSGGLTDEEFETQKKSVLTNLKEKDVNLQEEHNRHWKELTSHRYEFNRQNLEIEMLETITKEEFLTHFTQVFFSEHTKRLDLELTAAAHKEEQEKEREVNATHEMFKQVKRVKVEESLVQFKKQSGSHANTWLAGFI